VIFSYLHLFLVGHFSQLMVWSSLTVSVLAPLALGGFGFWSVYSQDDSTLLEDRFNVTKHSSSLDAFTVTTGDKTWDIAISASLVSLGLLLAISAGCAGRKIDMILGSLESSSDCIWELPGIVGLPLLSAVFRVLYIAGALCGLALVLSVGEVEASDSDLVAPAGIARSLRLTLDQKVFLGFYCFMALWGLELLYAIDHFAFSYATSRWYFMDYDRDGRKPITTSVFCRGYALAVTYHLGSLALGSLTLAHLRAPKWVVAFVHARVQDTTGEDGKASCVAHCLTTCCCFCLTCWEKFVRFLNKEAYLVVSVESVNFFEAAERAYNIIAMQVEAVSSLQGATTLFQIGGLVSITTAGAALAWGMCRLMSMFCESSSSVFVSAPELVAAAAACVSLLTALSFTLIFDTVSDSMLFCWALENSLRAEGHWTDQGRHAPKRLEALIDKTAAWQHRRLKRQP